MERVKRAPRARKKTVEPVADLDINKVETVTPGYPYKEVAIGFKVERDPEEAVIEHSNKMADELRRLQPPRPRTWWELLRS